MLRQGLLAQVGAEAVSAYGEGSYIGRGWREERGMGTGKGDRALRGGRAVQWGAGEAT